jgi:peptide/nickel transport system ATP-binding protein/oligopeptide transport system ATP-binding protein
VLFRSLSAEPLPLPSNLRPTRRIILQGEIPSPLAPPSGCRFRTRCPVAEAKCADEVPQWRQVRNGHWVACHFAREDGHSATGANCNDQKGGSNEDAE